MIVRRAEASDAKCIAEVRVAAWKSAYRGLLPDHVLDGLMVEDSERRWREHIAKSLLHILVFEHEERIIGFAACGNSQDEDVDREKVGELHVMYVHPDEWRRGYGKALLEEAMSRMRGEGYESVILWVLRGNEQAIGFYEKAGFGADGASRVKQRSDGTEMPIVRYRRRLE